MVLWDIIEDNKSAQIQRKVQDYLRNANATLSFSERSRLIVTTGAALFIIANYMLGVRLSLGICKALTCNDSCRVSNEGKIITQTPRKKVFCSLSDIQ